MSNFIISQEILQGLLTSCTRLMDTICQMLEDSEPVELSAHKPVKSLESALEAGLSETKKSSIDSAESIPLSLTKEEVQKLLAEKASEAKGKYRSQVKALVQKYANGGTFTKIPQDQYPALLKELEAIHES